VAAKIAGVNGIAGAIQRGGEAVIASGMFRQAVDDLDDGPGRDVR
jgi:hypothetical protein